MYRAHARLHLALSQVFVPQWTVVVLRYTKYMQTKNYTAHRPNYSIKKRKLFFGHHVMSDIQGQENRQLDHHTFHSKLC
ncbi:hypothetical protein VTH06DRAFT_7260 [Thermothelomyces fergusii]